MPTHALKLPADLTRFLEEQVAEGHHASQSDVVSEALRRYRDDVTGKRGFMAELAAAVDEGERALRDGDYVVLNGRDEIRRLVEGLDRQASGDRT